MSDQAAPAAIEAVLPLGDEAAALVDAFLDHLVRDRGLAKRTAEAYDLDLRQLLAHIQFERGRPTVWSAAAARALPAARSPARCRPCACSSAGSRRSR